MATNNGSILNSFNSKLIQDTRSNNDKCKDSKCSNSANNNANKLSNNQDIGLGDSRSVSNRGKNQNNQCINNIECKNRWTNTAETINSQNDGINQELKQGNKNFNDISSSYYGNRSPLNDSSSNMQSNKGNILSIQTLK